MDDDRRALRKAQVEEMHREIGRFVVAFSVMQMKIEMAAVLSTSIKQQEVNIFLAGERGPEAQRTWVSLCKLMELATEDTDQLRMIGALSKEVTGLIEKRNQVMHGVWFVGWGNDDTVDWSGGDLVRERPGGAIQERHWTATELGALADQMEECGNAAQLLAIGIRCFGELPIPMEVRDGRVRPKRGPG